MLEAVNAKISIHALREEGDFDYSFFCLALFCISIHALREEGDGSIDQSGELCIKFLSTPSARRATSRRTRSGSV